MKNLLEKLKKIKMLLPWKTFQPIKKKETQMNTDRLISLKQNFTGQKFQWIKPDRPELLAKVVKCKDVDALPDGRFIIIFDDGSKIDSTKLNLNLLMIHGDSQPLTRAEVESIYGQKARPEPKVPVQTIAVPISTSTTAPPEKNSQPVVETKRQNMFAIFNSEEATLTLNMQVRIPERKLLKLMYQNAENKEQFVSELADHLHAMINKQVVKNSIQAILAPPLPKREKATINLTEVDGTN
jgi:hypothetical protein